MDYTAKDRPHQLLVWARGLGSGKLMNSMVMNTPLVYGIILNWNGSEETIACLHSMQAQTYLNLHLLVIDNGSVDDSVQKIKSAFPDISLIENDTNLGFAGGVNVGLRHALAAGAEYVLILNNDLVIDPNCVMEMTNCLQEDIAFVTAVIYYTNDPNRIWSIGGHIHPLTLEKTSDARGILDTGQLTDVLSRDFVPGGATMMSRIALEKIGLFDERFFLYYEDADISLRALRAGLKSIVATKAKMWHSVSASAGGTDSPRERYWMARSSIIYFYKHARLKQIPIIIFWRTGSALRTTYRLLRKGNYLALRSYWRGLRDGFKDVSQHKDKMLNVPHISAPTS